MDLSMRLRLALSLSLSVLGAPAYAQADAFAEACKAALTDIQDGRQACHVAIVDSDTQVIVLVSNFKDSIFKRVSVFQSKVMDGSQVPLDGLARMKGQTVAVGGFYNDPNTIYSARLLSK